MEHHLEIEQLHKAPPKEYVRRFFEERENWECYGEYLCSDRVIEALSEYLRSIGSGNFRLYRLVNVRASDKKEDGNNIIKWIQKMADDFINSTILSEFLFGILDKWSHTDNSSDHDVLRSQIVCYFDYIGNCIYKEKEKTITYITDIPRWRKSIDAKTHVEILTRYLNDRLADEKEYNDWRRKLPPLFKAKGDLNLKYTGIYQLFFKQMLCDETAPFMVSPLTRQTKKLLTLCFYECRWDYLTDPKPLSTHAVIEVIRLKEIFYLVANMILTEKLYIPDDLVTDHSIDSERPNLEKNLTRLLLNWISFQNAKELTGFINEGNYLFAKSMLNAIKIAFSGNVYFDPSTLKCLAEMVVHYPPDHSPNILEQTDPKQWSVLRGIADQITFI